MGVSLNESFADVYSRFKLQFYRHVFSRFAEREASLTSVETICVEVIQALKEPTISEFAKFVNISQANATYRIQSLIKKGYIIKRQSATDKREYNLVLTERYHAYSSVTSAYIEKVSGRIEERFAPQESALFKHMLDVIAAELMPEAQESLLGEA
jgi:DNA-binding MarR family transcriptional regulator